MKKKNTPEDWLTTTTYARKHILDPKTLFCTEGFPDVTTRFYLKLVTGDFSMYNSEDNIQ